MLPDLEIVSYLKSEFNQAVWEKLWYDRDLGTYYEQHRTSMSMFMHPEHQTGEKIFVLVPKETT